MEEIRKSPLGDGVPYAGFGVRLVAYIIDAIILLIITGMVFLMVNGICKMINGVDLMAYLKAHDGKNTNPEIVKIIAPYMILMQLLNMVAYVGYQAGFNASKFMATPGKIALNIIVVDIYGEKISILRAICRSAFYSVILFILGTAESVVINFFGLLFFIGGHLNIFIDSKKRGVHDMFCGTYVIHKFYTQRNNYEKFFEDEADTK